MFSELGRLGVKRVYILLVTFVSRGPDRVLYVSYLWWMIKTSTSGSYMIDITVNSQRNVGTDDLTDQVYGNVSRKWKSKGTT